MRCIFLWKDELVEILFSNDPSKINAEKAINLKYIHTPSSLYKYKSFDDKGHSIELLQKDKMWLSRPTSFNDPFDCALKLSVKDLTKEYIAEVLINGHSDYYKQFGITNKELDKLKRQKGKKDIIHELVKLSVKKDNPDLTIKERDEIIAEEENRIKNYELDIKHKENLHVTCFSKTNESILMWSHYADNHKGFCVEYDFKKLGINNPFTRFIFPVFYTESVFDMSDYLDRYDKGFDNVLKKYMGSINPNDILDGIKMPESGKLNNMSGFYNALQKFRDWSYEKEWRYVFPYKNISNKKLYLPVPKPKAIYLGAMVSKKNCAKILKIGKERHINIYKMNINSLEFALESNIIHKCNDLQNE